MRVVDLHCDTVGRIRAGVDIGTGNRAGSPAGHVDVLRLRAGDVGLQAFAVYVSPDTDPKRAFDSAISMIESIEETCRANPEDLEIVANAISAEQAATAGRIGVLLTVENGYAIEESIQNLEALRRRGVRAMTLVHSKNTSWVASCSEERCEFDGLSGFGERVVDAMNELGMIVDVSHTHESAFWKVAACVRRSGRPFIASHSNAWELCRIPRNLKDDQIREIADQGGVIGINFFPMFLDQQHRDAAVARNKEIPAVTSESIARHIDHIVKLVGDDYVAFGSDFDGIPSTPVDVTGSDAYPLILRRLTDRGYPKASLEKIARGNFMRVLRAHDRPGPVQLSELKST